MISVKKLNFSLILIILIFSAHYWRPIIHDYQRGKYNMTPVCGDEPHYLVMINSLIRDQDFELSNNYRAAYYGRTDAGLLYASIKILDHHTVWYENGKRVAWFNVYPVSTEIPPEALYKVPQYPAHPIGFALVYGFILKIFNFDDVEAPSYYITGIFLALLSFTFFRFSRFLTATENDSFIATLVTITATPLWYYGRTVYSEILITFLLFAAVTSYLRNTVLSFEVCGFFLGIITLIKPPLFICSLPILAELLFKKRFRDAVYISLPLALVVLLLFSINQIWFGSMWNFSMDFLHGDIVAGSWGLLFNSSKGLLLLSPFVLFCFYTNYLLFKNNTRIAFHLLSPAMLYYLLMSYWGEWWGGTGYGPRLIVPVIPLLTISLAAFPPWRSSSWYTKLGFTLCALYSVFVTLIALYYPINVADFDVLNFIRLYML